MVSVKDCRLVIPWTGGSTPHGGDPRFDLVRRGCLEIGWQYIADAKDLGIRCT